MPLSETVQDGFRDLDYLAEMSSRQLNTLLEINRTALHSLLVSQERDFPELLVAFNGIPRGPDLVRSFFSSSHALRFFFDAEGIYELDDTKPLRRGDALGEHRGVTDSLTIVKQADLSRFGLDFFSTFLAGLREFLESGRKMPLVSVPIGHYAFRYTSYWGAGGIDTPPKHLTQVYVEESLEAALKKFCHSITIGYITSIDGVSVAVPNRDNWFLLNNGSEFDKFNIGKLSLPDEICRA